MDHSFSHHNNPVRKSCHLATVVDFALNVKKNGSPVAGEETMVSYKQLDFVSSTLRGYKNVTSDARGPKQSERVMEPAAEWSERVLAKRQCPKQKSYSMLRELVSRLSQRELFVANICAKTFPAAETCFMVPSH